MKTRNYSKILAGSLSALIVLSGCSNASQSSQTEPTASENSTALTMADVKIKPETVTGFLEDNVYNFLGIPYATAKRFQNPQPITNYENGKQLAISYGTVSPQSRTLSATGEINSAEFMTPSNGTADMVGNENCQNLNVWTKNLDGKKPVIVFFHGGGLTTGASSELSYYTGEHFASNQDVVFVSVNHRLNHLGFLDLSDYGDEKYAESGLAGINDCKVALQWVQDNISQFGGDPENVTIVGQSGGGGKVTTLASMSDTKDLFDKVMVMSGYYADEPAASGKEQVEALRKQLNVSKEELIPTLENMSYEDLYEACNEAGISTEARYGIGTFDQPFINEDGEVNENAKARTWMIGSTFSEFSDNANPMIYYGASDNKLDEISDEDAMDRLKETYGNQAETIADEFQKTYPDKPLSNALFLNTFPSNLWSRIALNGENGILRTLADQGVTVYNYITAYNQPFFGGVTMYHTSDIPFWFGSIEEADYLVKGDEVNAEKVSETLTDALAAFAKTGKPGTDELQWDPYTKEDPETMIFDVESGQKKEADQHLYELIAQANQ